MAIRVISVPLGAVFTRAKHIPAANTAAVITLDAVAGFNHRIRLLSWSYSEAPTGGRLTIAEAGVVTIDLDITGGGPGLLPLDITFPTNTEIVVTLAAGGAAVSGKLNVEHIATKPT